MDKSDIPSPDAGKPKRRRGLAGKAKDEPDPAWRRFFMEVDNRRKALTDRKKKPLVISSIEKDGQVPSTIARQKSEPTEIKKLLKNRVVKKAGSQLAGDLEWLRETWPRTVGEEVAAASEVYAFKNGTLTITVFSSVLLQEIRQFHQEAILQDLRDIWQASIPLVKIVYRIGKGRS